MKKTAIQHIKAAAAKLRKNQLQRLGGKEVAKLLDNVVKAINLADAGEAIIFIAIFDRSCAGRRSDLDDIANYYHCEQLDIMEYASSLRSLLAKGMIVQTDLSECRIGQQNFLVTNSVMDCILENRPVDVRDGNIMDKEFDKYDLCHIVDQQVQDDDISAESLFQFVKATEHTYVSMPFVKELSALVDDIPSRALFYEICYDFYSNDGLLASGVEATLKDIYESYGPRLEVRRQLANGSHPLMRAGLIRLSADRSHIKPSLAGQRLFLGEDFSTFGRQYDGLTPFTMAREITQYVFSDDYVIDSVSTLDTLADKVRTIEDSNPELPAIDELRQLVEEADIRALFYMTCDACAGSESLNLPRALGRLYPIKDRHAALQALRKETHKLQRLGLVELTKVSSLFGEYNVLELTDKGKMLYFRDDAALFMEEIDGKDLIRSTAIKEKHLYFSEKEQTQLQMVHNSLEEDKYQDLTERLEQKGLSKGIAVLLYGAPGTGKTESVLQWARATGRDIVHVDISQAKSMWYGESEKIVKGIFDRYRRVCRRSTLKPILLFNEADAIFSKRRNIDGARSTDQTENTIQNIILEEMERLEGILIATTNLADNLDRAFERRFLFKIRLERPLLEAKRSIWMDKIPTLSVDDATVLAEKYDFSGGEIDNITRKAVMAEVVDGKAPTLESLTRLCEEERILGRNSRVGY